MNYPILKQQPNLLTSNPTTSFRSPCERADQWKKQAKDMLNTIPQSWDYLKQKFSNLYKGGGGKNNFRNFVYRPANNKTMRKQSVRRRRRGGSSAHGYRMLNDVASNAAPISGIRTAAPHQWTRGGSKKTRRHRRR